LNKTIFKSAIAIKQSEISIRNIFAVLLLGGSPLFRVEIADMTYDNKKSQ